MDVHRWAAAAAAAATAGIYKGEEEEERDAADCSRASLSLPLAALAINEM